MVRTTMHGQAAPVAKIKHVCYWLLSAEPMSTQIQCKSYSICLTRARPTKRAVNFVKDNLLVNSLLCLVTFRGARSSHRHSKGPSQPCVPCIGTAPHLQWEGNSNYIPEWWKRIPTTITNWQGASLSTAWCKQHQGEWQCAGAKTMKLDSK